MLIPGQRNELEIDRDSNVINKEVYDTVRTKLQNCRTQIQFDEDINNRIKEQIKQYLVGKNLIKDREAFLASFGQFVEDLPEVPSGLISTLGELKAIDFEDLDIDECDENDPRLKALEQIHKSMLNSFTAYKVTGEEYIKHSAQYYEGDTGAGKKETESTINKAFMEASAIVTTKDEKTFNLIDIAGDGNCFYRAVADQLARKNIRNGDGQYYTHEELRQAAINYINIHREQEFGRDLAHRLSVGTTNELRGDLPANINTLEDYVAYHRKDRSWADTGTIGALAQHLDITLRVYRNGEPAMYNNGEWGEDRTVNLQYTGNHYNSLVLRAPSELLPFEKEYPVESYKIKRIFEILDTLERSKELDKEIGKIGKKLKLCEKSIQKLKVYINARNSPQKLQTATITDSGDWYTDEDMNSYGKCLEKYGINLEQQFSNRLTADLISSLSRGEDPNENQTKYICYNIAGSSDRDNTGNHWVAIVLVKHREKLTILYKDSKEDFGNSSAAIEEVFRQQRELADNLEFIKHPETEQNDDSSSGPMAINNLAIMARLVKEENDLGRDGIAELVSRFKGKAISFTTQDQVSGIRIAHLLQNVPTANPAHNSNQDPAVDNLEEIINKLRLIDQNKSEAEEQSQEDVTEDDKESTASLDSSQSSNIAVVSTNETEDGVEGTEAKERIAAYVHKIDEHYEKIKLWTVEEVTNWAKAIKGKLSKDLSDSPESADGIGICEAIAVMERANEIVTNGHRLRNAQKAAIVTFMQSGQIGHISQINTGEGKTTIVSIVQALKVLQGYKGHVITSNNVLAGDGVKNRKLFYTLLDITAAHNNPDEKSMHCARACYSKDIVYGSITSFQFDYLNHSFERLETLGDTNYDNTWVMLDEIDSLLIDQGGNIAKLSSPLPGMESLRYVYINIWVELEKAEQAITQEILEKLKLKAEELNGRKEQGADEKKKEYEAYEDELRESFLDEVKTKIESKKSSLLNKKIIAKHLHQYAENSIDRWIGNAFSAKYQYREKVEYKIGKDKDGENIIIPVDNQNTGVSMNNTILSNGLHQFLQIKHNLCLTYESVASCYVSNLDYIRKYGSKLSGVTGTLGSDAERKLLGSVFNLGFSIIPPYKPKKFELFPGKVSEDKEFVNDVAIAALVELTRTRIQSEDAQNEVMETHGPETPRAVLILCASTLEAMEIAKEVKQEAEASRLFPKIKIYTDEEQADITEKTLDICDIVIATNLAGRGTDFKTTYKLEQNGGLHVIEAFLPCNKRVEDQGTGRTSRQGKSGTGQIIVKRSEVEAIGITDTSMDFDEILEERDELESQRVIDIRKNKVTELEFKDKLFNKFSKLYGELKDEHKKGADYIKWQYVLKDLKEKWAFWLEKRAYTAEKIKKLADSSLEEKVNTEYKNFLSEAESIIAGQICHNPFYSICLAERYLEESVNKESRDKAKVELFNAISISGDSSKLLYSAYIKLFEIEIEGGEQVLQRYAEAVKKIFFFYTENSEPEYKRKAQENLEKARDAIVIEYDYLEELINEKKIDNDKREKSALEYILVDTVQSAEQEISKAQSTSIESETNTDYNLFIKHLESRLAALGAYKENIESLIKQLSGKNEFEKSEDAIGATDGIIIDIKIPRYLSKLDSNNELKKYITDKSVKEFEYSGAGSIYQLRKVYGVPGDIIAGAQVQIGAGFALIATAFVFPFLLPVNGPIAGAMISEGITDIVIALIDQGNTAFSKAEYLKGKAISYGIAILTMGIGVIASSTKILTKAMNACRSLATKLRAVRGPFSKVCGWVAKKLDKLANYLERTINAIKFAKMTAANQAEYLSKLKDATKIEEFQKLQKALKFTDKVSSHGKKLTQIIISSAVGAIKGVAISVAMERIFIATLDAIMQGLQPVIKEKVKSTVKERINTEFINGRFNCLSQDQIKQTIRELFKNSLEEDIEHIAKEIALGVLRHGTNWKAQLATLTCETISAGVDIATYTKKICDRFFIHLPQGKASESNHKAEVIDNIIEQLGEQLSEQISSILYSKIVAITGKVVITLPKALYRGYKQRKEKNADKEATQAIKEKLGIIDEADSAAQKAKSHCVHDAAAEMLGLDEGSRGRRQLADATNFAPSENGASVEEAKRLLENVTGNDCTSHVLGEGTGDTKAHFNAQDSDRGLICLSKGEREEGHAALVIWENDQLMVTEGRQKMPLEQYKQTNGYTRAELVIPKGVNATTLLDIQHQVRLNRIVNATYPVHLVGQNAAEDKFTAVYIGTSSADAELILDESHGKEAAGKNQKQKKRNRGKGLGHARAHVLNPKIVDPEGVDDIRSYSSISSTGSKTAFLSKPQQNTITHAALSHQLAQTAMQALNGDKPAEDSIAVYRALHTARIIEPNNQQLKTLQSQVEQSINNKQPLTSELIGKVDTHLNPMRTQLNNQVTAQQKLLQNQPKPKDQQLQGKTQKQIHNQSLSQTQQLKDQERIKQRIQELNKQKQQLTLQMQDFDYYKQTLDIDLSTLGVEQQRCGKWENGKLIQVGNISSVRLTLGHHLAKPQDKTANVHLGTIFPIMDEKNSQELRNALGSTYLQPLVDIGWINGHFGGYTLGTIEHILQLRLAESGVRNVMVVRSSIFHEDYHTLHGIIDALRELRSGTVLAPLSLYNRHAVGIMKVNSQGNNMQLYYIDPSNEQIPAGLKQVFTDHNLPIVQLPAIQQSYANCGPEVIENFMLYLTGERLSQEEAVVHNSRLVEQELIREASSLPVIEDHTDYASSYPQLSDDTYGSDDNNGGSSANAKQTEILLEAEEEIIDDIGTSPLLLPLLPAQNVSYPVTSLSRNIPAVAVESSVLAAAAASQDIESDRFSREEEAFMVYDQASLLYQEAWEAENDQDADRSLEAEHKFAEALKLYEEAVCLAPDNVSYKQAMDITSLKIEGNTLFGKGLEFVSVACDLQDEINALPADHAAYGAVLEKYNQALVAYEQAQEYFHAGLVLSKDNRFESCIEIVQDSMEAAQQQMASIYDDDAYMSDVTDVNNPLAVEEPIELFKHVKQDYLPAEQLMGNGYDFFHVETI